MKRKIQGICYFEDLRKIVLGGSEYLIMLLKKAISSFSISVLIASKHFQRKRKFTQINEEQ